MADKTIQELSADICIIGGAGAGLTAAVRAVENEAQKVVLLEKMKYPGGCTRMAMGVFSVGSPAQKRAGLDYSVDECYKYHMNMSSWYPDAKLVRKWMCGTADVIGWIEDHGCRFDFNRDSPVMMGIKQMYHSIPGKRTGLTIVKHLVEACNEKGVEILTSTKASKLITDNNGNVTGVLALRGKDEIRISAKAVIIATGSISHNKALLARFYPGQDLSNVQIMADVPHNTGDGLIMAEEIGAASTHISTLYIGPHGHGWNERTGALMRFPVLIRVNRDGERFSDESMGMREDWAWMASLALDRQPDKVCYALMDEKMLRFIQEQEMPGYGPMAPEGKSLTEVAEDDLDIMAKETVNWLDTIEKDIHDEEELGRAKVADSWEGIAEYIGCPSETLKNTISEYNTFCRDQYDAEFLKDPKMMMPLDNPPYYALKAYSGIDTCIGGLRTNHRLEVLNKDLYPIKGLYAAGVVVGNWCGIGYGFMGSEMSFTTYSGHAVGKIAAEFVKHNK